VILTMIVMLPEALFIIKHLGDRSIFREIEPISQWLTLPSLVVLPSGGAVVVPSRFPPIFRAVPHALLQRQPKTS